MIPRAGLIAAGDGSRLAKSHPATLKPLVPVSGVPLCHYVVRGLRAAGVKEITILLNSRGSAVRKSLEEAFPDMRWDFLCKDTASSWESFRLVSKTLAAAGDGGGDDGFLMGTIDALIPPAEVRRFADEARRGGAEAGLALTAFVDDEKPLWADLGEDGLVTGLGPDAAQRHFVTSGLYYLTPALAAAMPEASVHDSLRGWLRSLVQGGARVAGVPLAKTVDVDRPEDIVQAEGFVQANIW